MPFQHDKSWEILTTILESRDSATNSWKRLIDALEMENPIPCLAQLKGIDIAAEQEDIANWIHQVLTEEPLPPGIIAIWVGILKLVDEEDNEIPTIYIGGADNYDAEDIEWACDLAYLPENRYGQPVILQEIDEVIKTDNKNYSFLDWILPLAYCAFNFDELSRKGTTREILLQHQDQLFLSAGFDSGDYINLTAIQ